MSHHSSYKSDDFEWSGPRPPVPGEESRRPKMTGGYSESIRESPPACLKWASTLSSLLEDREGVELFKKYVEAEGGIDADRLKFYFACEGLKQQSDHDKVKLIIGAIYRFLRKSQLPLPDDIRQHVKAGLKNEIILASDVYDQMQSDVERIINETTYPNFLQSDIYIQHVQYMQNANVSSTASSSSTSENASKLLSRSSTLPTLHEDAELHNYDTEQNSLINSNINSSSTLAATSSGPSNNISMALTKDSLRVTQLNRLEKWRPPGTPGYSVYNAYSSYNPVSRRDSELASLSSGRTDSDTKSTLSTYSFDSTCRDGRPHVQRRHHSSMEKKIFRENVIAHEDPTSLAIIPRTQRSDVKKHALTPNEFLEMLIPKLVLVQRDQEKSELLDKKLQEAEADKTKSNKSLADAIREKFPLDDDNDQDILDQHVSRIWSDLTPSRSPGIMSPCPYSRRRQHDLGFGASTSSQSSIRHSKSMPENQGSRKLMQNKWPSINTDSGISVFSSDTVSKYKEPRSMTRTVPDFNMLSTASQLEETSRRLEDESRRLKRYNTQSSLPQRTTMLAPPPIPAKPQILDFTTVVYSFCDEEVPYRIKIPGSNPPTLKQFKDYLPKKGNYRFFFKTRCDDLDNPVIQEEINNDLDVLPLFEGKVMGTVKPAE